MADEIKPPVSGSTTPPPSSLSPSGTTPPKPSGTPPSFKVPDLGASAGSQPGGTTLPPSAAMGGKASPLTPDIKIPPNLPTGEIKPPIFPKLPAGPSVPLPPPLTPKPGLPGAMPTPSQPATFKSSIRTMQDDLSALKKGESPAGFKMEKESEKEVKPTPQTTISKITPPPSISHVELGKLEKARPLAAEIQKGQEAHKPVVPVPPQLGSSKPSISIPSVGGGWGRFKGRPDFKRIIIYAIVGFVGFGITAYFIPRFVSLPTASVSPTPSATITATPTAALITPTLSEILGNIKELIKIPSSENPYPILNNYIDIHTTMPLNFGQKIPLGIINDETGEEFSLTDFFNRFQIPTPSGFIESLDSNEWTFLFYGQGEKFDNNGLMLQSVSSFPKIAFISKVNNPISLISALNNWEATITSDFQKMFSLDTERATSETLLDNTYKGANIRYVNFPFADNAIDYSIINLPKFDASFFIFSNSRESMYSIIDLLQNL